jgi:hypothetical protein
MSVVHGWMNAAAGGGKTSAVVVCGHSDDTVFEVGDLGRPGVCRFGDWID